ncbi:MAG: GAF domain-containing sensor histidine kinase [Candidatus Brocadiales bacterium]
MRYYSVSFSRIIKRIAVYTLLITTISISYVLGIIGLYYIIGNFFGKNSFYVSSIIVALFVAFATRPQKEGIQFLLDRTFFREGYSHKEILAELSKIMSSILNLNKLLELFPQRICTAMDIEKSFIVLKEETNNCYTTKAFNNVAKDNTIHGKQALTFSESSELIKWLSSTGSIMTRSLIGRTRGSKIPQTIKKIVAENGIEMCVPIFFENMMIGALFVGRKRGGKVFSEEDIDFFHTLSHQIAVAIRNAQLYTELEDNKVYEENILNSLKSGVIVINMDKKITLLNHEACRVLNLNSSSVLGKDISFVSKDFSDLLSQTLDNNTEFSRAELVVTLNGKHIPLGANTSFIRTVDGSLLGIIMVFTDLTAIKKLEAEKRWADRLANFGTLAAGMAHEIKNPLVAIKTFLQLLPEKFNDESFRKDFLGIACSEVERINKIIEKLLSSARPSNSLFEPMDLHRVIKDTLYLLKNEVAKEGFEMETNFCTEKLNILGNKEQMTQVFLNLFLNGFESMAETCRPPSHGGDKRKKGRLEVTTTFFKKDPMRWPHKVPARDFEDADTVTIKVSDTGTGVSPENINQIFDPFFTTKQKGSGLGLSIVHGIVEEHRGTIDVESTEGKGTSFYISLQLLKHDAKNTSTKEFNESGHTSRKAFGRVLP